MKLYPATATDVDPDYRLVELHGGREGWARVCPSDPDFREATGERYIVDVLGWGRSEYLYSDLPIESQRTLLGAIK